MSGIVTQPEAPQQLPINPAAGDTGVSGVGGSLASAEQRLISADAQVRRGEMHIRREEMVFKQKIHTEHVRLSDAKFEAEQRQAKFEGMRKILIDDKLTCPTKRSISKLLHNLSDAEVEQLAP